MKLFGAIKELVSAVFRKDSNEITLRPNQSTTYTAARDIQFPPGNTDHVVVSATSTQTLTNKTFDADGTGNSITNIENADIKSGAAIDAAKLADGSVSNTEFQYIGGLTSDAQTQLNAKLDDFSSSNDNRVVRTDGTGGSAVQESPLILSDVGALSGITQLDADNVRIDGNTVSSTSGDLNLNAGVNVVNLEAANVFLRAGADLSFYDNDNTNAITISVPANVTANRTPQIPDDTGNFVLTSATQTLTNKTLTSPAINTPTGITKADVGLSNVDNTSNATERAATATLTNKTLTAPILDDYFDVNEEAAPGTPASGKVRVYAKTDQKLYTKNSNGVEQEIGSGSGQGEKTYVENASAAVDITGWNSIGDIFLSRTVSASELPREFTTGSGIKITADTNTQSVADYVYYDFNLDDVDLNKKLKIQWSQKQSGAYVAGQLAVVITTQADRTTAIATPDVTAIPAYDGVFTASFDTASTAALSLVIRATADMATSTGIVISDVIVGPGNITAAAPIGAPTSYTPTGLWTTNTTYTGSYTRVGNWMKLSGTVSLAGAPNATVLTVNLPSGFTIDTSVPGFGADSTAPIGVAKVRDVAPGNTLTVTPYINSTTSITFGNQDDTGSGGGVLISAQVQETIPITWASGDYLRFEVEIPIAEWAGAPNYAGQNDVEYAAEESTWAASGSTTVYGPNGSAMGGALGATRTKTITWQTPIQPTDRIELWVSIDRITWVLAESGTVGPSDLPIVKSLDSTGALVGGVHILNGTVANQTRVRFARYMSVANDDAPANEWPSSNAFWVVTKARAGAAVGFGAATTTRSGLVDTGTQSFAGNKTFTGNIALGGLRVGIATESGGAGTYTPDVTNLGAYVFEGGGIKTVNTINGGVDGKVLFLIQQSNAGNTLLITNAGNIRTASGSTVTLTNHGGMLLVYQNDGWQEISSGV